MVRMRVVRDGRTSLIFGAPWAERRSGELSDDSYHLALDLDLAGEYRLHLTVRRLEADALLLSEEALERHAVVLEERDDDVSVPGRGLRLDDDVIAVIDERVDHALAADPKHVRAVARLDGARHVERFCCVGVRLDGLAGRDLSKDRQGDDVPLDGHPERCDARGQATRSLAFGPRGQAQRA